MRLLMTLLRQYGAAGNSGLYYYASSDRGTHGDRTGGVDFSYLGGNIGERLLYIAFTDHRAVDAGQPREWMGLGHECLQAAVDEIYWQVADGLVYDF